MAGAGAEGGLAGAQDCIPTGGIKGLPARENRDNSRADSRRRVSEANLIDAMDGAATRLMLKGGEIIEVVDATNLKNRGTFFELVSINEINSF